MSKNLTQIVKEIQFLKNWNVTQVAKSINYSRVHLSKEMKKDNEQIKELLLAKHKDILQNVIKNTSNENNHDPLEGKNTDEWMVIRFLIHEVATIKAETTKRPFLDCLNEVNHSVALALSRSIVH